MNLQKMMKQAQDMQNKIAQVQARVEASEVEGVAAGGLVKLRLNGKKKLLKVQIDASLMKPEEKDILEDLLVVAHNDAADKIDADFANSMSQVTSGMQLPPGIKLPF